ncbi:MAG: winged helix-turn-helix transcriptional regulator [Nanoarchaeota archaeon]
MLKIDLIDKKILKELSVNSRQPVSQIAKKIKISTGKARYRISNLEKIGIIEKFTTVINTNLLGFGHYNLNLNLIKANLQKREEIINYLNFC